MHHTFMHAHTPTQNLWFGRNVHLWYFPWPKRPWPKCPGRNVLGRNVRGRNVLHSYDHQLGHSLSDYWSWKLFFFVFFEWPFKTRLLYTQVPSTPQLVLRHTLCSWDQEHHLPLSMTLGPCHRSPEILMVLNAILLRIIIYFVICG